MLTLEGDFNFLWRNLSESERVIQLVAVPLATYYFT